METFDSDGDEPTEYTERIYEYQKRSPSQTQEEHGAVFWTNKTGDVITRPLFRPRKEDPCPPGWQWKNSDWFINTSGLVDQDGWFYAKEMDTKLWSQHPHDYHQFQRREYVRVRTQIQDNRHLATSSDCWEYSTSSSHDKRFYSTKQTMHFSRRKRLTRECPIIQGRCNTLEQEVVSLQKYFTFQEYHMFQLRAYLYQARDLYRGDYTGLSDPYVIVTLENYSGVSVIIENSLCPVWNQTLHINNIKLYGDMKFIRECEEIKCVSIQLWDKDVVSKDDFLGEARGKYIVQDGSKRKLQLQWLEVRRRQGQHVGDILAAFELVCTDGEWMMDDDSAEKLTIPKGIAPVMEECTVEFYCWGLRNMKKVYGRPVTAPHVELECESKRMKTETIFNAKKNHNFSPACILSERLKLPMNPSMTIKVYDKRMLGRTLLVGSHVIKSLAPYTLPEEQMESNAPGDIHIPQDINTSFTLGKQAFLGENDVIYDWWSKYYYSMHENGKHVQEGYHEKHKDKIAIYPDELENHFADGFTDFLQPFGLYRGKGSHHYVEDQVGCVKGVLRVYKTPSSPVMELSQLPSKDILVRVYVIEAMGLTPQDFISKSSDPYLVATIGKQKKTTKQDSVKNDLNPTFGKMFQFICTLPYDHTLSLTVMDYDRGRLSDDVIGETRIDLENRYYSNLRGTCGLPESFKTHGVNQWRDSSSPVEILYDWVRRKRLAAPEWSKSGTELVIGGRTYKHEKLEDCSEHSEQKLALHALRDQGLVPEHVETRTLYNPLYPDIAQGKVRMWVDIFDRHYSAPPPVCIASRVPEEYELRVIVWNTMDVKFDDVSLVTGEPMSDIYVKGWLCHEAKSQKTDVHWRSLDGTGNFNWRYVFPFEYIKAENVIVTKKRDHLYQVDKTKHYEAPILTIEIWDNDVFSRNDFIGRTEFNLTKMHCSLRKRKLFSCNTKPECNLFVTRKLRGWWAVKDDHGEITGKVELEFELLERDEAQLLPAGKGREEPNMNPHLHKPKRPESSFLWLFSPLKSLKFIIWRHYKWTIVGIVLLIILIVLMVAIAFTLPSQLIKASVQKMMP